MTDAQHATSEVLSLDYGREVVLSVVLDRNAHTPIYQQLRNHMVHAISTGRLPPGTPLPSIREVSAKLGISPSTVQTAYNALQSGGLAESRLGTGMYVSDLDLQAERPNTPPHGVTELLAPGIAQARAYGYTTQEIGREVQRLLHRGAAASKVSIAIVEPSEPVRKKYVRLLGDRFTSLAVEVVGSGATAEEVSEVLEDVGIVDLFVCLVSRFGDVRMLGDRFGVRTVGLQLQLSERNLAEIRAIEKAPVALVVEGLYVSNTLGVLKPLLEDNQPQVAIAAEELTTRSQLGDCEVVLHSLATASLVERIASPRTQLIELDFEPSVASVEHLAELVSADVR